MVLEIAALQEPMLRRVHARTTSAIKLDPERPEYHRAALHWTPCVPPGSHACRTYSCIFTYDGGLQCWNYGMLCRTAHGGEFTAVSTGGQISSRLLSMRSANALLELPAVRSRPLPTE